MQFCLARMNTRKDPLNPTDLYLTCFFKFSFLIPPPPAPCAMAHHLGRCPELAGLVLSYASQQLVPRPPPTTTPWATLSWCIGPLPGLGRCRS
jgi:hypothetical protein